jgi:hypothetical protein
MRDYGYYDYDDDDPLADREPPDPPPTLEEIAHDAIAEQQERDDWDSAPTPDEVDADDELERSVAQQERDVDAGDHDGPPPAPLSVRHP